MSALAPARAPVREVAPLPPPRKEPARDNALDFLRFLGVVGILIAHTTPPAWLFQLRQFDVPLVVLVSTVLIERQYRRRPFTTGEYLRKRAGRLLAPAWVFFLAYFAIVAIWARLMGMAFPYPAKAVIGTFLLGSGIGFVWIFRINLAVAVAAPALLRVNAQLGRRIWLAIPAMLGVLELIHATLKPTGSAALDSLIKYFLVEPLPYCAVALIGFNLWRLTKRQVLQLAAVALLVFVVGAVWHRVAGLPLDTQSFRVPAQTYYLSYALFCSLTLYALFSHGSVAERLPSELCDLGAQSMWIYLWHILGLFIVEQALRVSPAGMFHLFVARFAFVILFAILATQVMRWAAREFILRQPPESTYGQWASILFLK